MIFSSLDFLFFFIIYFFFHITAGLRNKNLLIIIGSSIFYAWWRPENIWIPFFLIFVAFASYKLIINANGIKKLYILIFSLITIYLPLIFYKYLGFFYNDIFSPIFNLERKSFLFSIPLGISFITFTLTSFLIDVYKKKYTNNVSLKTFISYILYFPQLIAGPILRPNELIPQLQNPKIFKFNFKKPLFPILIFTIGCLKKFLFADYISQFVENVFDTDFSNTFLETLLGIYSFSIQIYCDFSGYTDMAIGISLLLGINLPSNFLSPYTSASLTEFWRKWHITLSNFLKDYIYIPLGGNKKGTIIQLRNLITTMILGGLWHGANWTFLIWGALHGFGLAFISLKNKLFVNFPQIPKFLSIFITFNFVSITWIFFRAQNFEQSFKVIKQLFRFNFIDINEFFINNSFPIGLIIFFLI